MCVCFVSVWFHVVNDVRLFLSCKFPFFRVCVFVVVVVANEGRHIVRRVDTRSNTNWFFVCITYCIVHKHITSLSLFLGIHSVDIDDDIVVVDDDDDIATFWCFWCASWLLHPESRNPLCLVSFVCHSWNIAEAKNI